MEASDITNYGIEGETFQYNADGEAEYIADYVKQFKDASPSDYYACWTDIGAGKLDFSMYACNTNQCHKPLFPLPHKHSPSVTKKSLSPLLNRS